MKSLQPENQLGPGSLMTLLPGTYAEAPVLGSHWAQLGRSVKWGSIQLSPDTTCPGKKSHGPFMWQFLQIEGPVASCPRNKSLAVLGSMLGPLIFGSIIPVLLVYGMLKGYAVGPMGSGMFPCFPEGCSSEFTNKAALLT